VYLAYVDESGNAGAGGSFTYSLSCVLVHRSAWAINFDRLISFRRFLRVRFGLPIRAEIKANYLLRNGGPFRPLGLSEKARRAIYRQAMRLHPKLDFTTFAVSHRQGPL